MLCVNGSCAVLLYHTYPPFVSTRIPVENQPPFLCQLPRPAPLAVQSPDHVIGANTRPVPAVKIKASKQTLWGMCARFSSGVCGGQAFTGAAAVHMTSGRFYLAIFSHNCIRTAAVSARVAVDHSRDLRRRKAFSPESTPIEIAMHSSARYPLQNHAVLKY